MYALRLKNKAHKKLNDDLIERFQCLLFFKSYCIYILIHYSIIKAKIQHNYFFYSLVEYFSYFVLVSLSMNLKSQPIDWHTNTQGSFIYVLVKSVNYQTILVTPNYMPLIVFY